VACSWAAFPSGRAAVEAVEMLEVVVLVVLVLLLVLVLVVVLVLVLVLALVPLALGLQTCGHQCWLPKRRSVRGCLPPSWSPASLQQRRCFSPTE
jgi:hypothetical protein